MKGGAICFVMCSVVAASVYAAETVPRKKAVTLEASDEGAAPPPPTVPVSVMNFPAVQPVVGTVTVDNLPATQQVAGTVSVDNLPAVQAVSGTVNVGNLPFAEDGSLRVAPGPAKQALALELLTEPIVLPAVIGADVPVTVMTEGFSAVGIWYSPSVYTACPDGTYLKWRWAADEEFSTVVDDRSANVGSPGVDGLCAINPYQRTLCRVAGAEFKLHICNNSGSDVTLSSVRVYLFP